MPLPLVAAALWGTIASSILAMLRWLIPYLIHYVLIALGIGYVTYVGMDLAIDEGISFLEARYANLPVDLIAIVQVMGVPDAIQYITTAATSAIAIKLTAGVTKMVANRPASLK
jgi:hypothetical protein